MSFWTEIHWSEGMFLRPHHLQAGQRWLETLVRAGFDNVRPFGWGLLEMRVAKEPLENFTLRVDQCMLRLKDGTWLQVPENTEVAPWDFKRHLESSNGVVDIHLGIPHMQEVRANSISLEQPGSTDGSPRYQPQAIARRDENTGKNPQTVYVRRMRGRLFAKGEDITGYETVRIGTVRRTDRPGAVPEFDPLGAGPLLAIQADVGLSALINSLADQVEAKDQRLADEALEHRMTFTDGVAHSTEHLLKLHVLNGVRAHLRSLLQNPILHPYDIYLLFCRLVGDLSIFHDELVPGVLPSYDHDYPAACLDKLRRRIIVLLEAMQPLNYSAHRFVRQRDLQNKEGLQVELERKWIDEKLELYIGLETEEMEIQQLEKYIYSTLNFKLASPTRVPRIMQTAVRGLRLEIRSVPAGTLPRRQALHYFKVDKAIGPDRTDYWGECERENGMRIGIQEGQLATLEKFKPTLYVVLKER